MNRRIIFFIRLGIGLIILFFLIYMIGIQELISTFSKINPVYILHVFFLLFILFLIGSINIWLLLNIFHSIGFAHFLKTYSYSWIASLLTPGQIGDASLIFLLKKKFNIAIQHTSTVYLTDKIITLTFFLFIGLYGSVAVIPELEYLSKPLLWSVLIILLSFLILLISFKSFNEKLLKYKKIENIRRLFLKWKILLLNLLITVFKWLIVCIAFYFAFLAFGIKVSWPEIGIIPIISTLVGYIPISVAGIGTVEITAGYLFLQVGVETSVVLSAYLLLRILQYLLALLLLGSVTYFENR